MPGFPQFPIESVSGLVYNLLCRLCAFLRPLESVSCLSPSPQCAVPVPSRRHSPRTSRPSSASSPPVGESRSVALPEPTPSPFLRSAICHFTDLSNHICGCSLPVPRRSSRRPSWVASVPGPGGLRPFRSEPAWPPAPPLASGSPSLPDFGPGSWVAAGPGLWNPAVRWSPRSLFSCVA